LVPFKDFDSGEGDYSFLKIVWLEINLYLKLGIFIMESLHKKGCAGFFIKFTMKLWICIQKSINHYNLGPTSIIIPSRKVNQKF